MSGGGAPVRSRLPEGAPVYGTAIWLVALLPLLSVPLLWFMRFDWSWMTDYIKAAEQSGGDGPVPTLPTLRSMVGGPGLLVAELLSLMLTAALVVLAYRDHQSLLRLGVVRPFHWAWAFLGSIVYVIGRGVIVRKVAAPRGHAPTWAAVAVTAVALVNIWIWEAVFFASFFQQLPSDAFT
jgi:hypothetical protein